MFSIIIPNYNNARWLDRLFWSIYDQKFYDYEVIFIDDASTDNSYRVAEKWRLEFERKGIDLDVAVYYTQRYNGGARNVGLFHRASCYKYTLFMDSDDYFADENCLAEIARIIKENNEPDLVRLSYFFSKDGNQFLVNLGRQTTVEEIVNDENVACWTKCIKSELVVPFPENTLMEDVVQHIAQMDKVKTIAGCEKGIIVWNRDNPNSCSRGGLKWESSIYRYYADLLDLRVSNPACQAQLNARLERARGNILKGVALQ